MLKGPEDTASVGLLPRSDHWGGGLVAGERMESWPLAGCFTWLRSVDRVGPISSYFRSYPACPVVLAARTRRSYKPLGVDLHMNNRQNVQ